MKCTEVMEWMHRYLDHDLSPDETIEMYRHIDNCPSCAEVFDRLTMLSEQLEQLPDVKPPFNLVDSILPQLEEIDLGVQGASAVSPEDAKVVPLTRKNTHGKTVKGTSRAASMAMRTGIGAVAAAIILLIAVLNIPDSMPAADVERSLEQAARSNEIMSQGGDSDTAAPGDTSSNAASDELGGQFTPSAGADGGEAADTAAPAAAEDGTAADAADEAPAADDTPAATDKPAAVNRSTPATRNTPTATPAPRADTKAGGGIAPQDAQTFAGDDEDAAAEMSVPLQDAEQEQAPAADEVGTMGLLPMLTDQSAWNSPDGKYTAELAGQQLVIYSLSSSGLEEERTAVASLPLEGTWVSGAWSADSLQFAYVTMQDGIEVSKAYMVPAAVIPGQ